MSDIIYVFDKRTEKCFDWNNGNFAAKPGDVNYKLIEVTEQTWVSDIVDSIYKNSSDGEIKFLRIIAHGHPTEPEVLLGKDGIKEMTVYRFGKLSTRFAKDGKIELHSCAVLDEFKEGSQTRKKPSVNAISGVVISAAAWCQSLADFTNADVIAAEKIQLADKNWAFEGPTRTFRPVLVTMQEEYDKKYGK